MPVTKNIPVGRKDESGNEIPWQVPAPKLDVSKYPTLEQGKDKKNQPIAKVPVLPSAVSYPEFSSFEEAQSTGGTRFNSTVLRLLNSESRALAESAAKKAVSELETYSGDVSSVLSSASVDVFSEPVQNVKIDKSTRAKVLSIFEETRGMSDAERLRVFEERFNAMSAS